jgi:hypothetical protein
VNWIISTTVSGPTVAWFQGGDVPLALGMVVEMNWGLHRAIRFRAAVLSAYIAMQAISFSRLV